MVNPGFVPRGDRSVAATGDHRTRHFEFGALSRGGGCAKLPLGVQSASSDFSEGCSILAGVERHFWANSIARPHGSKRPDPVWLSNVAERHLQTFSAASSTSAMQRSRPSELGRRPAALRPAADHRAWTAAAGYSAAVRIRTAAVSDGHEQPDNEVAETSRSLSPL